MQMRSVVAAAAVALVLGSSFAAGVASAKPPEGGTPVSIDHVDPSSAPAPGWGPEMRSRSAPAPSTSSSVTTPGATFVFTYREPVRPELKRVFEEAGRRWGAVVSSSVPIQVVAREIPDPRLTGVASVQALAVGDPPMDPRLQPSTTYSRAQLNAVIGRDAFPPGSSNAANIPECTTTGCDVAITIGGAPLYYGLDGRPPADQRDALSLVQHEIGHGLGYTDALTVQGGSADYTLSQPTTYDRRLVDGSGRRLVDIPRPSTALADAAQSGAVFFDGPATVQAHGSPVRVLSTNPYSDGNSISHVSRRSLPRSVMTTSFEPGVPFGGATFVIDGPTAAILGDIGWPLTTLASVRDGNTAERVRVINFPVTLSQRAPVPVTIGFRTVDGTAKAGEDYTATTSSITIPGGGQAAFISIPVVADQRREGTETMGVQLTTVAGAGVDRRVATGTILDP